MATSNEQPFNLQPGKRYAATCIINSPEQQTIYLNVPDNTNQNYKFLGRTLKNEANVGTYVFVTGASGKVSVTADGANPVVSVRLVPELFGAGLPCYAVGASSSGNLNDVLVVFNGPLD
jgi:hypothetical protein